MPPKVFLREGRFDGAGMQRHADRLFMCARQFNGRGTDDLIHRSFRSPVADPTPDPVIPDRPHTRRQDTENGSPVAW